MTFDERARGSRADQTTVRRANLGVVLRHIAAKGTCSRADVAAGTGLTRGTVSSLVAGGCIISGGAVRRSLISTGVRVHSYSVLDEAVILPDVDIGRRSRLSRVVVDRAVRIPDGLVVGEDPALDAKRFRRTDMGICLITQSMIDALA